MVEYAADTLAPLRSLFCRGVIKDETGSPLVEVHLATAQNADEMNGHHGKQTAPVHRRAGQHAVEAVLAHLKIKFTELL